MHFVKDVKLSRNEKSAMLDVISPDRSPDIKEIEQEAEKETAQDGPGQQFISEVAGEGFEPTTYGL